MLSHILQIILLLILFAFYVCDILFLVLHKNDTSYQAGFGITGFLLYPMVVVNGIVTIIGWPFPGGDVIKNVPYGIFLTVYGVIGVITQITIGCVFNFTIDNYFITPIITYTIFAFAVMITYCFYKMA